jgi:pyruvate/2-oxoglutarate dehydrogenase complex dihydrolipoamide dehydrogenase (E3) component
MTFGHARMDMVAAAGGGEDMERYDMVVLGGGAAGINAAKAALALGASVALIDRGPLGGSCVNRG